MPNVAEILAHKDQQVHVIAPTATVLEATMVMNRHKIGALVVMDEGKMVGMFTERDVLQRVVAEERSPNAVSVAEAMTSKVICVEPDTELDEAGRIMQEKRVRHLPVCTPSGRVLGLISMGDLNAFHTSHQEQTISYLQEYIYGRA